MNQALRFLLTTLTTIALCVSAAAEDVVKLKDGKTYKGEIVEQTDDYMIIRVKIGGLEQKHMLWANNIESIERDGEGESPDEATPVKADATTSITATDSTRESSPAFDPNQKRIFFVPMHGTVGIKFRQDKLEQAVERARSHKADVIVLEINSGGGLLLELYELRDYLAELREEFRVVSWIKSAISAAAMTAINTREIYFMREGHMGAATAFYGIPGKEEALKDEELEEWLRYARQMADDAGHSPLVVQAMIEPKYWLSADREVLPTGEVKVTYYDSDQGEKILSRPGEILTLTASDAQLYGVSQGTADSEAELARMLNLESWVEVSKEGRQIMESWWILVDQAEKDIPKLLNKYEYLRQRGGATEREQRRQLGERANILREIIRLLKRDPSLKEVYRLLYGLDVRDLERDLQDIQRQLGR